MELDNRREGSWDGSSVLDSNTEECPTAYTHYPAESDIPSN